MKRITSESKVEEVMAELGVGEGEELRESTKRQTNLEKFAQLRSRNPQVTLTLEETPTAFVQMDDSDGVEEFRKITVTTKQFEQTITDLPDDYHDYLNQKAQTAHEVGHVLYSSYPVLQDYIEQVKEDEMDKEGTDKQEAEQYAAMFQNFYNVLEDGAIEKFLGQYFRVEEELLHLRATLHEDQYFGKEYDMEKNGQVETEYHYPFFFAVLTAGMNLGVYDNGELDALLDEDNEQHIFARRGGEVDKQMFEDELLPEIRKAIPDIQSEADAEQRTEIIYQLWKDVRKYMNRSTTSGRMEHENQQEKQESDSYLPGVPENLSDAHGEQDGEPISIEPADDGEPEESDSEDGQTYGKERGDKAETSRESEGGDAKEKAEQGIIAETKQDGNDWSEELEEIISALGAGDGEEELRIAEDGEVNTSRIRKAENLSRRTARLFGRKLRQLNKDKTVRGKQRGEFDSRSLVPAERGSTLCFKQTKEGENKDYSCMIVVDRSGSMSGHVEDVEMAVGAIAWGLEENGVNTCILDTESSMTTLSKPFGSSTDNFKKKVFAGRCSGGTPLTGTMKFARQRMQRGNGQYPFAIVVTDGRPSSVDRFKDQIKKANFPVLGLYVSNSRSGVEDQLSLYDSAVVASDGDEINQQLINLINQIIF